MNLSHRIQHSRQAVTGRVLAAGMLALAGVASAAPLAAQDTGPAATIDRAIAAWKKVRTAQGTFTQTVTNPLTGSSATARGTFVEQRPNRIAVTFTDPAGDRIVGNGKTLWIYTPSAAPNQVIRRSGKEAASLPIDMASQLSGASSRYTIADAGTATVDGSAAHVVVLTPKKTGSFTKAKVWVLDSDATIREAEVTEASGVVRHIHLTSLRLNAPVAKDAFAFTPPAGARVIDQ